MTSQAKPITLWGGVMGPNPVKVALVLTELGIPFIRKDVAFADLKGPQYTTVNPNGRVPALQDPNKPITVWESGAIIEYLIAEYDPDHKLSFPAGLVEDYHTKQWLYFQVSGQGPYYGQANWFRLNHSEKIQSAIDRYVKEIHRVTQVLETHLDGRQYLVGDKCTYADLGFITWQDLAVEFHGLDYSKGFPNVQAWIARLKSRPAVHDVLQEYAQKKAELYGTKE